MRVPAILSDLDATLTRLIKQTLLSPLKAAATDEIRHLAFRHYMSRAARSPALLDGPVFLAALREAWGNVDYSADVSFLAEAVERVRAVGDGAVLECGSGLSTILLSLAAPPQCELWVLENDVQWLERVATVIRHYQLHRVRLIHAPLRSYGAYMWYAAPVQRMPRFDLVICDGPPETTRGGRYGLLPVMAPCLTDDAVIVLDDANTANGRAVLARWADEGPAHVALRQGADGVFGVVTLQKRTASGAHSIPQPAR